MGRPDYTRLETHTFKELKQLPERFYFHNANRTRELITIFKELALSQNISDMELLFLKTAGLFRYFGYLSRYKEHKEESIKSAKNILPKYDYSKKNIETITGILMMPEVHQNPDTQLQKLMCDAGLYYFGGEDYFLQTEALRLESVKHGVRISPRKWGLQRLKLLEEHKYFLDSLEDLRKAGKKRNIRLLRGYLGLDD